jgi:hypothetical protein
MLFFATRKDVESYSQMPGKRILALEFSNFSGFKFFWGRHRSFAPSALANGGLRPRRVCPFSEVAPPVPEILDPPLTAVWTMGTLAKISEVGEYAVLKISELFTKVKWCITILGN